MSPLQVIRYAVFAAVAASALIALAAWAVRTRQVSPFSAVGRALRGLSDPFIKRIERRVVQRGGNPQHAAWWIFGVALVGGIAVISLSNWMFQQASVLSQASTSGRGLLQISVYYAGQILKGALLVRIIASWFGAFRYSRWMRPVYLLTDWIVLPIQKIIPPLGMIDFSALIAWLLLGFLTDLVLRAI